MYFLPLMIVLLGAVQGGVVKRSTSDICAGPSELTQQEKDQVLEAHNAYRQAAGNSDAANELKLKWNDELASRAQDWANLCEWGHTLTNQCDGTTKVGQNLFMIGGGARMSTSYDVTSFVKEWNDEKKDYFFNSNTCAVNETCGHYTQVVWAETMEVGCGINQCETVTILGHPDLVAMPNATVFACDYSPPGNYKDVSPYIEGTPCSQCPSVITSGGWKCEDDQCATCLPSNDPDCQCVKTLSCKNGGSWNAGSCECECDPNFFGESCENSCICADNDPMCPMVAAYCNVDVYALFMAQTCPKTCEKCNLPPSCFP